MKILQVVKLVIKQTLGFIYYIRHYGNFTKGKKLNGKYRSLAFIGSYKPQKFILLKQYNDKNNIIKLKNKAQINIGFVVYTDSTWNIDYLYKLLNNNTRFNVSVIVRRRNVDKCFSAKEFNDTFKYFKSKNYKTISAQDLNNTNDYDILFYLDPANLAEKQINLFNIPLNVMVLHTSYSFMLAGNKEKIKLWMYHLSYKYYTDSVYYKNEVSKYKLYTGNAEFLGFPKMDQYYLTDCKKTTNKKVIIYAPHHSVNYKKFKSATFEDNFLFILELAKKYNKDTFWIYKPHPLLRDHSVEAGIFKSTDDYDNYVKQWNTLENAKVASSGDYYSFFKESDAMITDSVSFLAEYQFTHKPLLLLQSGVEEYNDFGQSIVNILYKCNGKDFNSIENFIIDCINEKDDMYEERMSFFDNNLEYINDGEMANKRIYDQIIEFTERL